MEQKLIPQIAFKQNNDIGVIWAMDEATKLGFFAGNDEWSNLGQGEPEVGNLKGGVPRIKTFSIDPNDNCYGPTNGSLILRQTIANHYNRLYRDGFTSKYTAENVSIAMGGRLALSRLFTSLNGVRLGYKVPEYPAYHDMLNSQLDRIIPICIDTQPENNYAIPSSELSEVIKKNRLEVLLLSNPCNPTGHVIEGVDLQTYIHTSKQLGCTLIVDEFYSQYIYKEGKAKNLSISSAKYIDNVNTDSVYIVDGLTKGLRYPGWRLGWILGPKNTIEILGNTASSMDGGPSLPIQRAALPLFEPENFDKETYALRKVFGRKQKLMIQSFQKNGIVCSKDSNSTFYIWADISHLPPPLNSAEIFFKEALKHKVICVPGNLFDIHPDKQRKRTNFNHNIRFSFGPEESNLLMGLQRITELIQSYK